MEKGVGAGEDADTRHAYRASWLWPQRRRSERVAGFWRCRTSGHCKLGRKTNELEMARFARPDLTGRSEPETVPPRGL